jgi:hypothetical protein
MIGTKEIYTVLKADSGVLALVTNAGTVEVPSYRIAAVTVEPKTWQVTDSTITIYQSGADLLGEIYDVNHTVNCRASTETKAKNLARAVAAALHRVTFSKMMFYCWVGRVFPPADETDNFNSPVTVRVMGTK